MFSLQGKTALVTGATGGIGGAIARAFHAAGATVAISGRQVDQLEALKAELKERIVVTPCDLGNKEQVTKLIDEAVKALGGRLDILVNNAGLMIRKRFAETSPEEWRRQIDTCLYGTINCCHVAGPLIEAGKAGRIISLMGDSSRVGESGLAIAGAARAGVIALMKSLAREMGRSGTTCNSVSLGLVETAHDRDWVEANREKLVRLYPVRRLGRPGDVAPMVALLASDQGGWITGQVISVSGGYSMV